MSPLELAAGQLGALDRDLAQGITGTGLEILHRLSKHQEPPDCEDFADCVLPIPKLAGRD